MITIVAGIDFSLTGLAVTIAVPGRTIEQHVFGSEPAKRLRGRINRYRYMAGCVVDVLRPHAGAETRILAVIEAHPVHVNPMQFRGVMDRSECRGVLIDRVDPLVSEWIEINVTHVKVYATGMGNAKKPDVIAKCNERWGTTYTKKQDNECDSYVLTRMGCELSSYRAEGVDLQDCVAQMVATSAPPKPEKPKPLTKRQREKLAQQKLIGGE